MSTPAKKAATMPRPIPLSAMECNLFLSPHLALSQRVPQCTRRSHRVLHRIFEQCLCDFTRATCSPLRCSTALRPSITWHSHAYGHEMEDNRLCPRRLVRVRVFRHMAHCEEPAMGRIGWRVILPRDAVAALTPLGGYVPQACHGYRP